MHETLTLPTGLIHSALDPACLRFHFSLPPPQFCMSGVMLGLLVASPHASPPTLGSSYFTGRASVGEETQKPFQRKQPLRPENREMGAKSVQSSFITLGSLQLCLAVLDVCLSRSVCLSLFFSLSLRLSLSLCLTLC